MKATVLFHGQVIDIEIWGTSLAMVFRRAALVTTVVALCCAIGLHWIALQSFAWATMIIDYSKRAPLCQAIAQTFDGAHPCSLCHVVGREKIPRRSRIWIHRRQ